MAGKAPLQIDSLAELRSFRDAAQHEARRVGLVPTMGALHDGHLSLVRKCREECDLAVVSIYVNPSQFGPHEDFRRYPRTLEADVAALATVAADAVFVPSDAEMYPVGYSTWVDVGGVTEPLEGQFRPGHFRGVATVVLKLLQMVQPQVAFFGLKDYQQVRVIERMVADLNVPVAIRRCPTVREGDGLAMSSRNRYLSPEARQRARVLWKSLRLGQDLVAAGMRGAAEVAQRMREVVLTAEDARIDYLALSDPDTLQPVDRIDRPVLAALAVRIENTRLIDNALLEPPFA